MKERKPIDPALRHFLDEAAAAAPPVALTDSLRTQLSRSRMVLALQRPIAGLPNAVAMREEQISPQLSVRIYLPRANTQPLPVLVYLHGGGWVAGSTASHDPFCRLLSEAATMIVVSVEYRLAPEHRYPTQLENAIAALQWVAEHASDWGGDRTRLALGGDSAGGNMAAVVANRICAMQQAVKLRALLLLYPATDQPGASPSYAENATGFGLEAEGMTWFWNQYAPQAQWDDGDVYPLQLQKLPALPPTLVTTAEYDVLRDEGIAYADKLRSAGVTVTHLHAPDMHHNFPVGPSTVARFPQCDATLKNIARWLKVTLGSFA